MSRQAGRQAGGQADTFHPPLHLASTLSLGGHAGRVVHRGAVEPASVLHLVASLPGHEVGTFTRCGMTQSTNAKVDYRSLNAKRLHTDANGDVLRGSLSRLPKSVTEARGRKAGGFALARHWRKRRRTTARRGCIPELAGQK